MIREKNDSPCYSSLCVQLGNVVCMAYIRKHWFALCSGLFLDMSSLPPGFKVVRCLGDRLYECPTLTNIVSHRVRGCSSARPCCLSSRVVR